MIKIIILTITGIIAGISSGLFGIGGGIVIVPVLVYVLKYSQQLAVGTSLLVLLPPIGLAATLQFYKNGNIDFPGAIVIAISMFFGGYIGGLVANRITTDNLRLLFGIFLTILGIYTILTSLQKS